MAAASSSNFTFGYPTPGPQTPTGQDVLNHVFFLSNGAWKNARESESFDYIVIGSGFCSYALCERTLAKNPNAKILVIERGPFFLPEHFQNLPRSYKQVLGGMSETFPWRVTTKTWNGEHIKWQHGMVPFFGGRSTVWSAWCPSPSRAEMTGFPDRVIETLQQGYFESAKRLLNVKTADQIDSQRYHPVYGWLQTEIRKRLNTGNKHPSCCYAVPAPMAVGAPELPSLDFQKYSTPGPFLALISKAQDAANHNKGSPLKVVTDCIVTRILHEDGNAIALETTRGIVKVDKAKIVLAMGTLPATTLVQNSFPECHNVGKRFTSHFISAIVARVPVADFEKDDLPKRPQLAAIYYAGQLDKEDGQHQQYHIQLTAIYDPDPETNAENTQQHMPDVVATASLEQLRSSKNHVVYVCAVLGELDWNNDENCFRRDDKNPDMSCNSLLQFTTNENDKRLWDLMDEATFFELENRLSPKGETNIEYWHSFPKPDKNGRTGEWHSRQRPPKDMYRVPGMVHEASTLYFGDDDKNPEAPVRTDYRLRDAADPKQPACNNVYITGGGLWPVGASWNPTLTMVGLTQHLADSIIVENQNKLPPQNQQPFTTVPLSDICAGAACFGHN